MRVSKKLSSKSGLTIPKQIRMDVGLQPGAAVDLEVTGEGILVKKHNRTCRFCGEVVGVISVSGIDMCRVCAKKLVREVERHGI